MYSCTKLSTDHNFIIKRIGVIGARLNSGTEREGRYVH
jgi:hypothetical protein